jgi:protease-4
LHARGPMLAAAGRDPRVCGVVLVLRGLRGGTATASSLRALVTRIRATGKRAVVHLPLGGGTREAFVASAADRVLLGPQSGLHAVGLLSSTRYVRGALDKVGVVPEVHARGRYKTAAERLERASMSEPEREQLEALLDGVFAEILRGIATGRGVDEARARALIDGAPYSGEEAVNAGLVDGVAYEDELATHLGKNGKKARLVVAEGWWRPRAALRPGALRGSGVIGVVRIHGAIAGDAGLPLRAMAVDESVIAAVRLARLHPRVRAVVLHVDSPGGSALASDRMHHEIVQLAAEKPVVASMGDVAASGGYYVAAGAHAIVAQPTTLTGSIGVIGARLVIEPLLSRLGVATETILRGTHARLLDPFLPLADDDRAAVDRELERTYQAFLRVVAAGRRRSVEEIDALAQGRVWTGADALAQGLVDRLGGFEDALELVRERVGRGAHRLRVAVLRPPRRGIPALDPPERKAARTLAATLEGLGRALDLDPRLLALRGERVLLWDPVVGSIRS